MLWCDVLRSWTSEFIRGGVFLGLETKQRQNLSKTCSTRVNSPQCNSKGINTTLMPWGKTPCLCSTKISFN